ncbi:MAG: hypothetical protein ACK443_03135 [Methylococcaceae bacterium]|jgi:hypothetical protein
MTPLPQHGWIEPAADGGYLLTDAGYAAIGQQRPALPDDVQPVDTYSSRASHKLSAVVMVLGRPQGASSLHEVRAFHIPPNSSTRSR